MAAGATVKLVAPKIGGAVLKNGAHLKADGQLAGTPSVFFDAVAVILSTEGAQALAHNAAAIDFVRDAFGHLKAIAIDAGGKALLEAAGISADDAVVSARHADKFVRCAMSRQWSREAALRAV
jgi:catalase